MQRELGQEKKCLGSGHRAVDFDANKKNAGRKINRTPRKIPYFLHLSISGIHVHLHSELLHERFKYRFNLDLKF